MSSGNVLKQAGFSVFALIFYVYTANAYDNEVRLVKGDLAKTTRPPCCLDSVSGITCRRFLRLNETNFQHRCNYDVEFRLIQCCGTCNKLENSIPYDEIAPILISENCSDRYGEEFCEKYVSALDVWALKQWSCDGYSPYMAFRSCRKTCGFCDLDRVSYTLKNAIKACRISEDNSVEP